MLSRKGWLGIVVCAAACLPASAAAGAGAGEADPTISRYVSEVDEDTLGATIERLQGFVSRRSDEPGAFAAQDFLARRFRADGLSDVTLFDFDQGSDDVVAVQPGTMDSSGIYVICGHYDSTSRGGNAPGADDNGSGTAAVCEAARLLGRDQFEATIVYIGFSGEEQGLHGSQAWTRFAREEGYDIRGAINLDMIGWHEPSGPGVLQVISDSRSHALLDFALASVATYVPDHFALEGYLSSGNSDQQSFWDAGYPAIFFSEGSGNPFYHSSGDLLGSSVNDLDYLRRNVQSAVAALAGLARPIRITIAHAPLGDPDVTAGGYRVEARITSLSPLLPDSLRVLYRVDGVERQPLVMTPSGGPDDYAAVIPRQRAGSLVEYAILARDEYGRRSAQPPGAPEARNRFVVGQVSAFADGFARDLGWTVGSPEDDATTGIWVRAIPFANGAQPQGDAEPDSSDYCYITGNGLPGEPRDSSDVDGGRTTLTSPRIDLSGASFMEVEYDRWFLDQTFPDDTLRVLLSNDDGVTWRTLEEATGPEGSWVPVRFENVERLLPPTSAMRLRFVAEDEGRPSLLKAAIDAVRLKGVLPGSPLPAVAEATRIVRLWPNPSRGEVRIVYDLPARRPARLFVYDLLGRRVAEIGTDGPALDRREAVWTGRDARGRAVPSGAYFIRLEDGQGGATAERVLVVR